MSAHAADDSRASLRIGISLGLTGSYENITRQQQRAFRLWETHINERGGILGRKVQLIIRDDKSDPQVAKRIYEDFIEREKVHFVFAPYSSAVTSAVAPVTERHGYPMLCAGAASEDLWKRGYRFLFGTIPPGARYVNGFMVVLTDARIARIAVTYVDDAWGRSVADGTTKWAAEYGLQVVSYQKVPKGAPNMDDAARVARESGAQALVMAGHYEESVTMRKALKRIGWMPSAYYASVGPGLDAYGDALGADADGTFSASLWEAREDLKLPGSAEFLHAFLSAYGEKPSYQAAQAYAAGQVLERAIEKAGSVDRSAVRDALATLDTNVLVGRYVVDRSGLPVKQSPMVIQWQGKKREIVWPPELKTAAPVVTK